MLMPPNPIEDFLGETSVCIIYICEGRYVLQPRPIIQKYLSTT